MADITSNMVKEAANKTGFFLEFKAKTILEDNGYNIRFNEELIFNNDSQQIDILAWKTRFQDVIIECKGAKEGSVLILVKEPESKRIHPGGICNLDIADTGSKLVNTYYHFQVNTWLTFTGDFYHLKNDKILTPATKSDIDSNFFKAQQQISKAIGLSAKINKEKESMFPKDITPIILTNATIWVVDCENNTEKKYKWVLHRVSYPDSSTTISCNGNTRSWYILPIVNIEYFEAFLKSLSQNSKRSKNPILFSHS
jgi:hypothetical protein